MGWGWLDGGGKYRNAGQAKNKRPQAIPGGARTFRESTHFVMPSGVLWFGVGVCALRFLPKASEQGVVELLE